MFALDRFLRLETVTRYRAARLTPARRGLPGLRKLLTLIFFYSFVIVYLFFRSRVVAGCRTDVVYYSFFFFFIIIVV